MPGTAIDVFVVDFVFRPFAKIFEKMPGIIFLLLMLLYGVIAYIVVRSAYFNDQSP
jgi:hypothetical protein